MKLNILTALTAICCLLLCGCRGSSQDDKITEVESAGPVTVDSLLSNPDEFVEKCVTVTGKLSRNSLEDLRRMFLEGSADSIFIRVDATASLGGRFDVNEIGRKIKIVGLMHERCIDENYLQQLEKQYAANVGDTDAAFSLEDISSIGFPKAYHNNDANAHPDSVFRKSMEYYRALIEERKAKTGKTYLSGYYIDAVSCEYAD